MADPAPASSLRILNVTEINDVPRPIPENGFVNGIRIKEEPQDEPRIKQEPQSSQPQIKIKEEPKDGQSSSASAVPANNCNGKSPTTSNDKSAPASSDKAATASNDKSATTTTSDKSGTAFSDTVTNSAAVVAAPAVRPCCRFGIKCYRENATHREAESHPGDSDYRLPDYPEPPAGTPKCQYALSCYRRNPLHFQQTSHTNCPKPGTGPPAKRQRRESASTDDSADDDDMDLDEHDPYGDGDTEDEYHLGY